MLSFISFTGKLRIAKGEIMEKEEEILLLSIDILNSETLSTVVSIYI